MQASINYATVFLTLLPACLSCFRETLDKLLLQFCRAGNATVLSCNPQGSELSSGLCQEGLHHGTQGASHFLDIL